MSQSARTIRIAALVWGASILLSRVIGLVRDGAVGRILGGGAQADAYFAAFRPGDFLNYLLAAGALSLVLIPLYSKHLVDKDEAEASTTFSQVFNANLLVLAVATPLMWLNAEAVGDFFAPGFSGEDRALMVRLIRIMLPAQVFHVLGGILGATLQARDRHTLPALAPLVYTLGIIGGGLSLQSPEGFAWGVLAGSFFGPFLLPLIGCLRSPLQWRPVLSPRNADLRTWAWRMVPVMLGFSVIVVDDWLLTNQGSHLPAGSVATLTYGKQLMRVPMGVFGLATGIAAFPTLTRLVADGKNTDAYAVLAKSTRLVVVLAVGAQVAMSAAGPEIAAVILGQRIPPEQHAAIGAALALFGLGLWAWAAQTVVARGFYILGLTWPPTVIGTLVVGGCLPVYFFLREQLGVLGLPIASSIAISAYVTVLVLVLRRYYPGAHDGYGPFALRMLPTMGVGLATAAGCRAALHQLSLPDGLWVDLLTGGAAGTLTGAAYVATAFAVGLPEARQLSTRILARVRRGRR